MEMQNTGEKYAFAPLTKALSDKISNCNQVHIFLCQQNLLIANKGSPILDNPCQYRANPTWCVSFSRDPLVTNKIWCRPQKYLELSIQGLSTPTCLSTCHIFVSCQNVMQEIQCDAHMSQFSRLLPSKFATLTPPKFARTILTQHSHLKQITYQRSMKMHIDPPGYVCHTSLHLIGYICLTFLHCVFSSLSSMHSDPLRFVCQASFNLYTF